jgi:hypothetical protein
LCVPSFLLPFIYNFLRLRFLTLVCTFLRLRFPLFLPLPLSGDGSAACWHQRIGAPS